MKLDKALEEYLLSLLARNLSTLHMTTVRSRLRQFIEPCSEFPTDYRDRTVSSVTAKELHSHFNRLAEGGRSDGTMAGYTSTHRAFWAWLIKIGERSDSPATNLRRYSYAPKKRRAASEAAVSQLSMSLNAFIAQRNYKPRDVRDALAVSLSLDGGNRIGEIRSIRRRDVEIALKTGELTNNGRTMYTIIGHGKTGDQSVTFFNETAELFQLWLRISPFPKADFIFISTKTGRLLRRETMGRCFTRVCEFADVSAIRSHAIRKRNASEIQKAYHDPELTRQYLGHTTIHTTMKHYNDVDRDRVVEAAAKLASARRGDPLDLLFKPHS